MRAKLTAEYLRTRLRYDPDTGLWTWLCREVNRPHDRAWNTRWAGKRAGALVIRYWSIGVDGENHLAHRLAWLYMTGETPPEFIDHINYDPSDCRWVNLRAATKSQNMQNAGLSKKNNSGYKGVFWDTQTGMWRAIIQASGKSHCLGRYKNILDAHAAYVRAAEKYHGEFARIA